jgi:MYXO-CTERM domain-containing protein
VTTFRGCRAWWNSDDGWDLISQEYPVVIENSWAFGNGYINSGASRPADGNGNGFKAGSSKTGIRHIVRSNVAWGNAAAGFYANHSSGGNDWYNNTAYNNGTQYNLLASTWDADGNRTDGVTLSGARAHKMRNNVGFPNKNSYVSGYGVDTAFNTWDLSITPAAADFASVSDMGFMGPRQADGSLPNLDFMKLKAGSKLIDKGTNVGLPYVGAAPDLGAYEFGAVATGGTSGAGGAPSTGGAMATTGGAAGASTSGGTSGVGGARPSGGTLNGTGGAISTTGGSATGGRVSGSGGAPMSSGGMLGSGGTSNSGGTSVASGGSATTGGLPSTTTGGSGSGGVTAQGGAISAGGSANTGAFAGTTTGNPPADVPDSGSCSCSVPGGRESRSGGAATLVLLGLAWTRLRRRATRQA